MGQVKLVDAGFNLDPAWAKPYSGPEPEQHTRRADDFLVLDVEIESQEIYCVDTSFDLREDERVEQTCLRFTRKFSGYRVTLWELFVGWFVYSA